jgi:hypothetical protein
MANAYTNTKALVLIFHPFSIVQYILRAALGLCFQLQTCIFVPLFSPDKPDAENPDEEDKDEDDLKG